jgi:Ca-activated chloride channel family protein
MNRRTVLQSLIAAGAVSFAKAQPEYTVHSDSRLVVLDVSVRDQKGRLISGLGKSDFAVVEDGRPEPITIFAHDDLPVTVGILVDESASMRPKRAEALAAADVFIEESNPHDEIFVLNFNDHVRRGLPESTLFSDDRVQLKAALHRGTPFGKTALNDALVTCLNQLKSGHREKKAIVAISDGGDNASEHTRHDTLSMVERSYATIHTIGIYDEGDPDRDPAFLRMLSSISGGEALFPKQLSGLTSACRRIAKDIRARYTIGYVPQDKNNAKGLRQIRVRVYSREHGRLIARTRRSYSYEI